MNPANVPPWGCPWHGLVKGGQVAVPVVDPITYPQPSGFWYQQGMARRVAHPTPPDDNRSTEQQDADAALGRQWWNKAILAGGSAELYGRSLGSNRWIYIDPDGAVWLASTTFSQAAALSGSISVTLDRFGILGGEPERHTYSVTVSDPQLGQSTPALSGLVDYRDTLCDSTGTGSKVLFCLSAKPDTSERYTFPFMPLGWVELSLAGPGDDCEIALAVVKTRAQTLGTLISEEELAATQSFYFEPPPEPGLRGDVEIAVSQYPASARRAVLGRVLAIFYDSVGAHQVLTLDVDNTAETIQVEGDVDYRSDSFDGAFEWQSTMLLEVALKLDGTSVHAATYTSTRQNMQSIVSFPTQEGAYGIVGGGFTRTDYADYVPPGSGIDVVGPTDTPQYWGSITIGFGPAGALYPFVDSSPDGAAQLPVVGQPFRYDFSETLGNRSLYVMPAMHSLLMYSWAERLTDWGSTAGGSRVFEASCATPAGVVTASAYSLASATAYPYGSWCPITGQITRDTVPVCWV